MPHILKPTLSRHPLLAVLILACLSAACSAEPIPNDSVSGIDAGLRTSGDSAVASARGAGVTQFVNLRFEEVTEVRAVFRFDTKEPTRCEAHYGTSADALALTARDPDMVEGEYSLDHQIPLEDLMPGTTYYVQAEATAADGQVYLSEVLDFRTNIEGAQDIDGGAPDPMLSKNYALTTAGTTVVDVSSNFGAGANDASWGANLAIDGKMGTEWSSNGDGDNAFLVLDFGTARAVNRMTIRSRKMTDGTSIIHSVRAIFDDDSTVGPFALPDPDKLYTFDFETKLTQTVRIEAISTTGGNTGLKEVEFYGTLDATDG